MLGFVFKRYVFYGFIALEILLLPKLLSSDVYGVYEYIKATSNLLPMTLLGAHSGYMFSLYNKKKDYFNSLFFIGIIVLLISGLVASVFLKNGVYAITTIVVGLSFILEKRLLTQKRFTKAILFKPILSVCLLAVVFLSVQLGSANTLGWPLIMAYALSIVIMLTLSWPDLNLKGFGFSALRNQIKEFGQLVKWGFTINLATILFGLFIFNDRYFIKQYYFDELASYSLAFNFAQMVIIGITSVGLLTSVQIGESRESINTQKLKGIIVKAFGLFVVLGSLGWLAIFLYQYWVKGFEGIHAYYLFCILISGVFFVFGTISSDIFYHGKQTQLSLALLVALIISIVASFYIVEYFESAYILLIKSFILMCGYIAFGSLTFKRLYRA